MTPTQIGAMEGPVRHPRNRYAGAAGSIHNDETAQKYGLRGGTVAGSVHLDQFPPLLVEAFGSAWFETGSLSLYFRHATTDQDPVQAFLERPARSSDVQVRAWMTEPDGTVVAEGTASVGNAPEQSALFARDLRPVEPSRLRMLRHLKPGMSLGQMELAVDKERQVDLLEQRVMTEPLAWYSGTSPWGQPIAAPSTVVDLLYTRLLEPTKASIGERVGLFGAIEVRFLAGPVFLARSYQVSGAIAALSETPKTEVLWYDSWAEEPGGQRVATMRMMLRQFKASSPLYRSPETGSADEGVAADGGSSRQDP